MRPLNPPRFRGLYHLIRVERGLGDVTGQRPQCSGGSRAVRDGDQWLADVDRPQEALAVVRNLEADPDPEVLFDLLRADHRLRVDLVDHEHGPIGGRSLLGEDLEAGVEQAQGGNVGREDNRQAIGA